LKNDKDHSVNADVVRLHLLEDALGWIVALIAAVVMYFFDLPIIDPILSIALSIWLLWNTFKNLNKSVRIILQQSPSSIDESLIKDKVCEHTSVNAIHDIHLWTMDGQFHVFSAHIVLSETSSFTEATLVEIKKELKSLIASFGINHITLEFEWPQEDCAED
jgi:cobalt-zinc-cadmium efflux system protein